VVHARNLVGIEVGKNLVMENESKKRKGPGLKRTMKRGVIKNGGRCQKG